MVRLTEQMGIVNKCKPLLASRGISALTIIIIAIFNITKILNKIFQLRELFGPF